MKKILALFLLALISMPALNAQNPFKRTKFFNIGYVNSTLTPENELPMEGNYGAFLSLGNRYWLHKQPIAGMVKIGLDAIWGDINYVNLKPNNSDGNKVIDSNDPEDEDYELEGPFSEINTGSHQLEFAMGIGPAISVAPFINMGNQLSELRGSLYCHFLPSFSMILMNQNDDLKFNYGFVPFISFGGSINWKALTFFAEGRWGSANYKMASADDLEDTIDSIGSEDYEGALGSVGNMLQFDKWSMKTSSVRFGIGITF